MTCRREPERRGSLHADVANAKPLSRWKRAFLGGDWVCTGHFVLSHVSGCKAGLCAGLSSKTA